MKGWYVPARPGEALMALPAALVGCAPAHFAARPVEMRAALAMVADASDVLTRLLDGGHSSDPFGKRLRP